MDTPAPPGEAEAAQHTFRILLATDTHLGYLEKDPERGNDSFDAWEELLQLAVDREVDFILHGGDLFHVSKPSRSTLFRAMHAMQRHCLGDRPVRFSVVSDQRQNFHHGGPANFLNPNLRISMPIFGIHGNHDDPGGEAGLSAMDLMAAANYVNYFGKVPNVDDITISPLLLTKGRTRLALYGLGSVRDERLYRTFRQQKVRLLRPDQQVDTWFSIAMVHQNRVAHAAKNYVHEEMLEDFLDLIFWGHEHECLLSPQESAVKDFHIVQPGSSVATSLCDAEATPKRAGILSVYRPPDKADGSHQPTQFHIEQVPLHSVRPFLLGHIRLSDSPDLSPHDTSTQSDLLAEQVELMLSAFAEGGGHPKLPLLRLKVDCAGGYEKCNPHRFGQLFANKVANPNDILLYHKRRTTTRTAPTTLLPLQEAHADPEDIGGGIEDSIRQQLGPSGLQVLPESLLNASLHDFVEKEDSNAIVSSVNQGLARTVQHLQEHVEVDQVYEEKLSELLAGWHEQIRQQEEDRRSKAQDARFVDEEDTKRISSAIQGAQQPVATVTKSTVRKSRKPRQTTLASKKHTQRTGSQYALELVGSDRGSTQGRDDKQGRAMPASFLLTGKTRKQTQRASSGNKRMASGRRIKGPGPVRADMDGEDDDLVMAGDDDPEQEETAAVLDEQGDDAGDDGPEDVQDYQSPQARSHWGRRRKKRA